MGRNSFLQQREYTDRPLVADDMPHGRCRALVAASFGCGAARVVRPRAVASNHLAMGFQKIDAVNADCEHRREMRVFMSDVIMSLCLRRDSQ